MGRTTLICQDFPFPVQLIIREKLIRRKGVRFLRSSRPFSIHSRDSGAAVSPRRRVSGLPADDIENGTSWWRATCYDVKWFFPGTAKKNKKMRKWFVHLQFVCDRRFAFHHS